MRWLGRRQQLFVLATVLVMASGAVLLMMSGHAAASGQPPGDDAAARALRNAIDIHVHSYPDDSPRSLDALTAARHARARGMRAIVLKNHYEWTSGLAFIVRAAVPDIEVFGGVDLNLTVGGVNPAAVEYMTRVSGGWGRVVWMPTRDAENQVRYAKQDRPFVAVARNGNLLPEVVQVLSIIAKHNLILATGHVSAEEVLLLLREGRRQGITHMVVTHAVNAPVLMSVPQMREAGALGAYLEFVGGSIAGAEGQAKLARFADAIRQVGPQFCILSSDLGQEGNPLPTDGFGAFILAMRDRGFTDQELDGMTKVNPARLLGLP